MTAPVLVAETVTRRFPGPPAVQALDDLTLTIEPGERVALMGPSEAGKSTALNILGQLDRPSSGTLLLDGQDTATLTDAALSRLRGRSIGFVFQSFHLVPHRTVEQNVAMGLLYSAPPEQITRGRIAAILAEVGMSHRATARARTLSGGEAQRVALARALVHRPRLLLADEPTGNLDTARGLEIQQLLASLITEDSAQIIVTHDPEVAARLDRTVHVIDGATTSGPGSRAARTAQPAVAR